MIRLLFRMSVLLLVGLFATSSQATAQESSPVAEGITVTGYGLASAPAETGALQFVIFGDDLYSGIPEVPEVEATPGTSARVSMEPIVAAIEAHPFVDSVTVVVPTPFGSVGRTVPIARIDIAITAPTQEGLIALVNDAARAASDDRMQIGYIGASFSVADCYPLEQQARQGAVDDATRQAEVQAWTIGVGLGDIVSTIDLETDVAIDTYYGISVGPSNNCDSPKPMSSRGAIDLSATFLAYDPTTQLPLVEVYHEIQVTFAVGKATATPAV